VWLVSQKLGMTMLQERGNHKITSRKQLSATWFGDMVVGCNQWNWFNARKISGNRRRQVSHEYWLWMEKEKVRWGCGTRKDFKIDIWVWINAGEKEPIKRGWRKEREWSA
jgi:hypothetical protein